MLEHSSADPPDNSTATHCDPKRGSSLETIEKFAAEHRLKTRVDSDDGTKIIAGKLGHIYEYNSGAFGVLVIPNPPRLRYWGCTRAALLKAGLTLVQDGDGEGAAIFDPLDLKQAKTAIRAAGVKRKRQLSPEQRGQRTAFIRPAQESHLAAQELADPRGEANTTCHTNRLSEQGLD